jgi:hypothetical protein
MRKLAEERRVLAEQQAEEEKAAIWKNLCDLDTQGELHCHVCVL